MQNALSLWVGCLNYEPTLLVQMKTFEKIDELIIGGLLYCPEEKMREDFKTSLLMLATKHKQIGEEEGALGYLMRVLSSKFGEISQHPCR